MLGLTRLQKALKEYEQAVAQLAAVAQAPPETLPVRDGEASREVPSFRGLARPA